MKKYYIISIAAVLLAGIIFIGWRSFEGTPTYALWQTGCAITRHDWDKFNRYVDVDSITITVSKEVSSLMGRALMRSKKVPLIYSVSASAMIAAKLASSVRTELRDWVMDTMSPGSDGILAPIIKASKNKKPRLADMKKNKNRAEATIIFGSDIILKLEMEKARDCWRVKRISNTKEFLRKVLKVE